jgi:hypothetical protein
MLAGSERGVQFPQRSLSNISAPIAKGAAMFAAYKKNAAKRKAARAAATALFKKRIAEVNEQSALNKLSLEAARMANNEKLKAKFAENNAQLKAAWRQ